MGSGKRGGPEQSKPLSGAILILYIGCSVSTQMKIRSSRDGHKALF